MFASLASHVSRLWGFSASAKRKFRLSWISVLGILLLSASIFGPVVAAQDLIPAVAFSFRTSSALFGVIDRSYDMPLLTMGGSGTVSSCTVTSGDLPAGLNVAPSGSECVITGTPVAAGIFEPTIQAKDTSNPVQVAQRQFRVNIARALILTTRSVPNALLKYAYTPAFPLAATGGIPPYTWQLPATASGACSGLPTGTPPPGLTLNSATGVLSGPMTVASSTDNDYSFQVCVHDAGNAATPSGAALPVIPPSNEFVLNVLNPVVYFPTNDGTCIQGNPPPCAGFVDIYRTDTKTLSGAIFPQLGSTFIGADITGLAVSPDGTRLYVSATDTNQIGEIDTITNTVLAIIPVPGGGTSPVAIAISPDAAGTYGYILDSGSSDVTIAVRKNSSIFTVIHMPSPPVAIAFKPDGTRAYVTLSNGSVAIINTKTRTQIKGSPFTLSSPGQQGIAVVASAASGSTKILGYVAEAGGVVDVVDVTADPTASPLSLLTTVPISSGLPGSLAADATGDRVYVSLGAPAFGATNQFAVIDNTLTIPAQIAGTPFNLPDPTLPPSACVIPTSLVIPPVNTLLSTQAQAYFPASEGLGCGSFLDIIDNTSPTPSRDAASPILTADVDFFTTGIAAIPIPK